MSELFYREDELISIFYRIADAMESRNEKLDKVAKVNEENCEINRKLYEIMTTPPMVKEDTK
jgi:hypothetical protein